MPKKQTTTSQPKTTTKTKTESIQDPENETDLENESNPQSTKVVEIYLDTLKEYNKKVN